MDPIQKVISLLDENKEHLPEGVYLEICNNLKKIYATGDAARDMYLLNMTNDYLKVLEDNETLRHELVRARISRFENVTLPVLRPNSILDSLLYDPSAPTLNISR
jgi:hypothetical protein